MQMMETFQPGGSRRPSPGQYFLDLDSDLLKKFISISQHVKNIFSYIIYRGRKYNYVDLEINLLQSFQVFTPDYISKLNQILFYSKRLRLHSTHKV